MLGPAWVLAGVLALQAPGDAPAQTPPPPSAPADERPIRNLFRNLGRDLRDLPSADTFLLLAVGTGTALASHGADDDLNEWAVGRGSAGYVELGHVLGDGWLHSGAALGTYAVGRLRDDRFVTHLGSDLIRAQLLNAVLTRGLKLAAQRNRPHGGDDAMPSGHTSATFASAVVLQEHYGWRVGLPAYAVASFVGWSRIRDDRHWLTDVIVGATVGAIAGRTVTRGHGAAWVVVPTATSQGAAIFLVRRFP